MLNVCVSCPRYPSPVEEFCYMLNVCAKLSRYHSPVVKVCYMLNVCVSCPVITAQSVIC